MIKGLVLGKYDPIHIGHMKLIDFAKSKCDILYILLCMNEDEENISGNIRLDWLLKLYGNVEGIEIKYTDKKLPYTSKSDKIISKIWSDHIKELFPDLNVFITSEPYGEYVAEYLGIKHIMYDINRNITPISATDIRNNSIRNWEYIPDIVKPHFVKKICISGTESTGKTTLTEILASHFNTNYVPEWGRLIVKNSKDTSFDDILNIGIAHATDIIEKVNYSNKILFSDTDLNITKMYSKYFFDEIPIYEDWVEKANIFDLHIFLENDAPYIQDGTRLPKKQRDELRDYHYNYLLSKGIKMGIVNGVDWDNRTRKAIDIVNKNFFN